MDDSAVNVYTVVGMSCDHCRNSVLEEVREVEGVRDASLDLESGRLEVEGAEVSPDRISSAVELAGYELSTEPA